VLSEVSAAVEGVKGAAAGSDKHLKMKG